MKRAFSYAAVVAMAVVTGLVATGGPAQAYCPTAFKWGSPGAVKIRPGAGIPTPWDAILSASTAQWRGISGSTYSINAVSRNFVGPIYGGGMTHAASSAHTPAAPGVTITSRSGNTITSASVIFNPRWHFNDTGTFNQTSSPPKADVRTVLVHELGHWLTLNHPSQCSGTFTDSEKASSMHPNFTKKWNINADDRAGAAAMY